MSIESFSAAGSVEPSRALARHLAPERWMDAMAVAAYACDPAGRILYFNRKAAELWGRAPSLADDGERYCGARRLLFPDGNVMPRERSPMAEVLRTGAAMRDASVIIERPDGSRIVALVNVEPVFDEAGALEGALSCFLDDTARAHAHAAAKASEARLHTVLNALPAAVYTTDASGRITFYNEAAVTLAGRRPKLGSDEWCVSWRLYWPDGTPLPHDRCPMAMAIEQRRPIFGAEAVGERPDGSRFPFLAFPTPLLDEAGNLVGAVNMLLDISDRKRVENDRDVLIHELHHRVKNTLAVVQSIAAQTQRRAASPAEFVASFSGRLQAVAKAHGSLYQHAGRGADFEGLVREQVLLNGVENDRIGFAGPDVFLNAQQALHVALILHELGANARKHGALTVPGGRVAVRWSLGASGRVLRFHWRESGGPPVEKPTVRGFGSILIKHTLKSHGGRASIRYPRGGIVCTFALPLAEAAVDGADAILLRQAADDDALPQQANAALHGARLLVVEDEPLVAMVIESAMAEAGCGDVQVARTTEQALQLVAAGRFDAALLDAELAGRPVDAIAAALASRSTPFAFVTGHSRARLPRAFRDEMVVAKPFQQRAAISAVVRLLGGKSPHMGTAGAPPSLRPAVR